MTIKRIIRGSDEQNVLTRWRRVYVYTQRSGVCHRVKRTARRRERHDAARRIRQGREE